jgi:hypothetical protein
MKCQYCRVKLSEESLFCYRCGFNTYEAHLIAKRVLPSSTVARPLEGLPE